MAPTVARRAPRQPRELSLLAGSVVAFVAVTVWWLTQDARVQDWDNGLHTVDAFVIHDEISAGHLTAPFTEFNTYPACPPEQERGGRWAACWIRSSAGAAQRGGSKQAPADRAFFPGLRAGSARIPPQRGPKEGGSLAPTWRPCRILGAASPLTRTRSQSMTKQ
jgi:hypothetical protein